MESSLVVVLPHGSLRRAGPLIARRPFEFGWEAEREDFSKIVRVGLSDQPTILHLLFLT
jgi:hypothetical protein